MPSRIVYAFPCATALWLFMLNDPAQAQQAADTPIGGVIEPNYTGAVGTRVGADERPLSFQEQVYSREKVETGSESRTQLQFLDQSTLNVSPNSTVMLDRFVYDPETKAGGAAIRLTKGAFRFVSGEMTNEQAITIKTPTASMVIRGTDIFVSVDRYGQTGLMVNQGDVQLRSCGPVWPQDVTTNQQAFVNRHCETFVGAPGAQLGGPSGPAARPEGRTGEPSKSPPDPVVEGPGDDGGDDDSGGGDDDGSA